MAIVDMKKFSLFTFKEDREKLLNNLQEFKNIHVIKTKAEDEDYLSYNTDYSDNLVEIDDKISRANFIIEYLSSFEEKKSGLKNLKEGLKNFTIEEIRNRASNFSFEKNYQEILKLYNSIEESKSKIESYKSAIEELKPWEELDINISELRKYNKTKIFTGQVPTRYKDEFEKKLVELEYTYLERISTKKDYTYYLIVVENSFLERSLEIFKKFGFTDTNIKTDILVRDEIKSYEKKIGEEKSNIRQFEEESKGKVNVLEDFKIYYEYLRNEKLKVYSSHNFLETNKLDVIEGYVPVFLLEKLEKVIKDTVGDNYYFTYEDAKRDSNEVPIMLKNNAFVEPFEMMTKMYSMPRYNEIDPTPFFAPFYFIFAGIMVGDIGYGLLVFIGTLIALKAFNLDRNKKRFLKFFNYLSVSTIIWGIIFGSFFGGIIELPSLIDPANDSMELVLLSIILGGIHLFFGLGIKAYMDIRDKKPLDALYDVGFWYMTLVGIIGKIVGSSLNINPIVSKILTIIMVVGMIGILLTGGRNEKSIGAKFGWGVYSLYGISGYIGDFASYLRLMALVLSGSFIAVAINMITQMLFGEGILGIIFGIIIFVVFQLFNAFLSYLSAYVHTARLTYVEMFNKFYEGGGTPFKKLIEESKYFNIK